MKQRFSRKRRVLSHGNQKYSKLSHRAKIVLLKKVLCDRCEIKQTAHFLNINYSTAKTLMRKFKNYGAVIDLEILKGISDWFDTYSIERTRCGYKTIDTSKNDVKKLKKNRKQTDDSSHLSQVVEKSCELFSSERVSPTPITILQQVIFKQ